MVILALETATREGSVAVWDRGRCRAEAGDGRRTHGERLPGELLASLEAAGRSLADVDLLAVIIGPGSFTGLRVGIAAIQGLALTTGRLVVPVPTLVALAAPHRRTVPAPAVVAPCLDGQRGEVFLAAFAAAGEDEAAVLDPISARPDEAADRLRAAAGGRPVVLVGHGVRKYTGVFDERIEGLVIADPLQPLAATAAELAAATSARAVAPHALRPVYVRRPDAVIARERARAIRADGPPVTIRRATSDDLPAVAALQRETFTNAWGAEAIRWELENTDVARLYVMHRPDGVTVAYCACWMVFDELHINSLAVDPPWRRRGLARQLLRHVLREAAASGARAATLEVRRSNEPALKLYEGLGFRVEGERHGYYQEPREDALVLWHRVPTLW
jgi:tRNA threonylcarbamoyl adenosine modification protein YeaZ/ribosomal-protein-alanine acetyltransferase